MCQLPVSFERGIHALNTVNGKPTYVFFSFDKSIVYPTTSEISSTENIQKRKQEDEKKIQAKFLYNIKNLRISEPNQTCPHIERVSVVHPKTGKSNFIFANLP